MKFKLREFHTLISQDGLFADGDWVESKDQDPNGEVRLVQLADIGTGEFIDKSNRYMTREKAKELRCTFLEAGDILIARMPDPIGRACIFPGSKMPCVTVVDVCIVRPLPDEVNSRWLMHTINSKIFNNNILQFVTGTTRQRISRGNLSKLKIPLPPLVEQKRIAAILDKADTLRRKNQQAIQLADQFLRAVFLDMFGDPLSWTRQSIPLDWEEQPIGKIAHLKRGYDLPVQSRNVGKVPIYAANGVVGYHDEAKTQGPGVITGRSGTLGTVMYSKGSYWPLNTSLYVTDFFGNEPRYIQWFLQFYKLDRYNRGAGVPTLNRNLFLEEISFVPPKELQAKFVGIFGKVSTILSKVNDSSGVELFDALSQKAFAGEL